MAANDALARTNGYAAIDGYEDDLVEWRRDFHRFPELAFEERRTSELVAQRLRAFGVEVHRGLAKTGVVGTLSAGSSDRRIALRADMDALPIHETNEFDHRSSYEGVMHACGHDGHTTMLLGAARYLAETRNFDGTVDFIFQPAEEQGGGAGVMVKEGLFERFPAQHVYGLHNFPGVPLGEFALASGPFMSAIDLFEIDVIGKQTHGAWPHQGVDPVLMASHVTVALQSLVSRSIDPRRRAVVSVTMCNGGEAFNVIPDRVRLGGGVRTFLPDVQDEVEAGVVRIAEKTCEAYGGRAEVRYERYYPATVNAEAETEHMVEAARSMGAAVDDKMEPLMGSDDFAFLSQERPGSFIMIGNGDSTMLHTPDFDFNDELLVVGAKYWSRLVESVLPA